MIQYALKTTKMSSMWYLIDIGSTFFKLRMILVQLRICMGLVVDQPCAATPTAIPAPRPPRTRPANATLSMPAFQFEHSSFDVTNMMLMHSMTPFSAFHESACEACLTQGDVLGRSQQDQIPETRQMPMSYP